MKLLFSNADFAIPPEKQKKALEVASELKRSPNVQAKKTGKSLAEVAEKRKELAREYPAKQREKAARKQRIRNEALGLSDPSKAEEFEKARQILKRTKDKRALVTRLNSADPEVSAKALEALQTQVTREELAEIEGAYRTIANARKTAVPSRAAKNKNKVNPTKPTAPEKALESFNKRRDEFIIPDSDKNPRQSKTPELASGPAKKEKTKTPSVPNTLSKKEADKLLSNAPKDTPKPLSLDSTASNKQEIKITTPVSSDTATIKQSTSRVSSPHVRIINAPEVNPVAHAVDIGKQQNTVPFEIKSATARTKPGIVSSIRKASRDLVNDVSTSVNSNRKLEGLNLSNRSKLLLGGGALAAGGFLLGRGTASRKESNNSTYYYY